MKKRIILLLLLLIIITVSGIWGLSKSQQVMTGAQSILRTELSNALGSLVTVGEIELTSYNTITIHNTVIYDKQAELLLASEKITVTYSPLIILRGQAVVEAISHVVVENPTLRLTKINDGHWNIQDLLQQETAAQSSFGGKVNVVNGSGILTISDKTWAVEELNGSVDFAHKPTIDLQLQALHKGAVVKAEGSINNQKRSNLRIEASELLITDYQLFLSEGPLNLIDGSLKNLQVAVSQQQGNIEWAGEASLAGIDVDIDGIPLRQVEGNMTFSNKNIYLFTKGTVFEQPINVRGSIRIDTNQPILNLTVASDSFDPRVMAKDIPISGDLAFKADITGISTNPIINGKVDLPLGQIAGYQIQNGQAAIQMMNKKIIMNQSSADLFGGHVTATGVLELADQRYQLQLKGQQIDMGYVADLIPGSQGYGDVNIGVKGIKNFAEADIQGTVSMGQGQVAGVAFTSFGAGFYLHGENIVIDYARVNLGQGLITAQGQINQQVIQLAVYGENLPLEQLNFQKTGMISGNGNFSGQITGVLSQPEFTGRFTAMNGQVVNQPFAQLKGNIKVNQQQVRLDDTELIHGVTKHEIQGTLALTGQHEVNIAVRSHQARAENLVQLLMPNEQLTGNVDNELVLTGPLENLNAEGKILLTDGSFRGQLIAKAQGSYKRVQGVTTISEMSIHSLNTRIQLSGSISPQNELNFDIIAKNINLQRLNLKLPYVASGRAEFNGKLTGTLSSPAFKGELSADKLTLNGQEVTGVNGEIAVHDTDIEVPSVRFTQGGGTFNFSGGFGIETREIYGNLAVENAELSPALTILNISNKDIKGIVNGEMTFNGTLDQPNIWLTGILKEGHIGQYPVESVKVDVGLDNHLITIRELSATQGKGVLVAQGTADLNGLIAMEIGGRDIDAGLVATLFNAKVEPKGNMNFAAQITGTTNDPHAAISLDIANGGIGSSTFDSLYGLVIVDKKMIHVNQVLLKKGAYQASAYGVIPVAALDPIGREQADVIDQMDLKVRLDKANLSILPFLTKEVAWAEGQTQGEINLTGTLAHPRITGGISVNNGVIKLAAISNPIQKVGVDIRFEGDTISLKRFDGYMGKGSYSLTGTAKLQGMALSNYDLALILTKPEIKSKYFTGDLEGNLNLTNIGSRPKLSGNLVFENDIINIPMIPDMVTSNLDIGLDVEVAVGKKVRFYNPYLYDIFAEGRVKFAGSTREPDFSGRIVGLRGTVNYLRTQFKINEASVEFKQFASFDPIIKLDAQTTLQQVTVSLNVNGPINAMQFSLTSEPAMRQQEILSLLTLRSHYADKQNSGNSGGIGRDEVVSILGAGLQMQFVSEIEGNFRSALGLDEFKLVQDTTSTIVKKSYSNSETATTVSQEVYNIEMSKYLTDKLLLTYTMGLDHDKSDLDLSYSLSKRTSLNASIDEKNRTWFGFETRFKF
ncbi:translocation/assembly module TamB domain-containing protein [Pelosinus sp. sgz500959]|uniref:translocation/assembly module TamB domain-containing protein n=1 Tax=Pelosinus sp. sgz500959 TaxID=3242472 RepID=UPI00366B6463